MPKQRVLRAAPLLRRKRRRLLNPDNDEEKDMKDKHAEIHTQNEKGNLDPNHISVVRAQDCNTARSVTSTTVVNMSDDSTPTFDVELQCRFEYWIALALGHTSAAEGRKSNECNASSLEGFGTTVSSTKELPRTSSCPEL
jgi:hypothetical protein